MAGPKAEARVQVVSPTGERGTVPASQVPHLPDGARVLTDQELAQERVEKQYANRSLAEKALAYGVTGDFTPEMGAYRSAAQNTISAGLLPAATKVAADTFGPAGSGAKYAQSVDDLATGYEGSTTAGNVAGFLGGAALTAASGGATGIGGAAARATPMAALSAAGAPVEHAVAKGLAGLAAKGALGRAATTGASMAVRGAVEGAAYSAAEQGATAVLHDQPVTGAKIYEAAGHGALLGGTIGGVLGMGGSLIGSGFRSLRTPKTGGIALEEGLVPPSAKPSADVPSNMPTLVSGAAKEANTFMGGMLDAGEQAWRAVGGGQGLQTTRYAKEAAKHFGSTADLGQIALKHGLIDMGDAGQSALGAAWQAARSGTPADILPRAQLATETVGKKIGEITEMSGARVDLEKAIGAADSVADIYAKQAGRRNLVNAAREYGEDLRATLRPGADGKVSVQDLLEQRKFLDDIVYEETKTMDPRGRVKALREVRAKLENTITDALDEASGRVSGDLKAEYKALKRDYHGLRILSEAAEDSAARMSKNATFGLGEKISAGTALASGHLAAAPVLAVGGKMLRERGNAAAAAFLSRASKRGSFETAVRSLNRRLDTAAAGVLTAGDRSTTLPAARTMASGIEPKRLKSPAVQAARATLSRDDERRTQNQAQSVVKWIGDMNANPERVTREIEDTAAEIAQAVGPQAAEGYSASTMRALSFVAGYIPVKERRDPLDPRSVPPLMRDEAIRLVRATKYAFHPQTIFEDFSRGVITPEGLRAAKFIAPDSFEEFQLKLQNHVENHMLRNEQLTQSQRLRIDKLLGYPAGADLRPKSIARRQANYDVAMNDPSGSPPEAPTGNPPVNMNTQQSGFDAIESRMAG